MTHPILFGCEKIKNAIGGDEHQSRSSTTKDPLHVLEGPITRPRAKKIKEAMVGLVQATWAEFSNAHIKTNSTPFKMGYKEDEPALVHLIQVKEDATMEVQP